MTLSVFRKLRRNFSIWISLRIYVLQVFTYFEYLPSVGASGGCITIWKCSKFFGTMSFMNDYGLSVEMTSLQSGDKWVLTNIYGPSAHEDKPAFGDWLKNIEMPDDLEWLIIGDFNLIRSPNDRNKPGGCVNEMLMFNDAISTLGLIEIPLKGNRYTWSNKQEDPLLVRLDWFFTSSNWVTTYPSTMVQALSRDTSDHIPCVISIKVVIPKAKVFRFESYWMKHDDFLSVVQHAWSIPVPHTDKAKIVVAKFKNLRCILRAWQSQISNLSTIIANTKHLIAFLDIMEEFRDLTVAEWNFRDLLQIHMGTLLHRQKIY